MSLSQLLGVLRSTTAHATVRAARTVLASPLISLAGLCSWPSSFTGAMQPAPRVVDSSGVRLVEYVTVRNLPPAFRVDGRAYLDLGGTRTDENEELDSEQPWLTAIELRGGTIVVNEVARLKMFSREGKFVRVVGRRGSGPAEFQQTRELCRMNGDTIVVIDFSGRRISIWDSAGVFVRAFTSANPVARGSCSANGSLIVERRVGLPGEGRQAEHQAEYQLIRSDGSLLISVGTHSVPAPAAPVFFEPSAVQAGGRVILGNPHSYVLRVLDSLGRTRMVVRSKDRPRAIRDAEWARLLESMKPGLTRTQRRAVPAMSPWIVRPATYPAYRRVRVDPEFRFWVEDYEDRLIWTVFDSSGMALGVVRLPYAGVSKTAELVGVAADHLIVRWHDSDGVPHLSFHRMTRASPAARATRTPKRVG